MATRIGNAVRERFVAWALRVRPPEPAPIVLGQRRVYVLPTRAGLVYACSLLVMLVGAINYNLSLGHVLTFLLGGLGIAAILNTFRNLAGIRISPGRCEPVFAGECAQFSILVENRRDEMRCALHINLPDAPVQTFDVAALASAAPVLALRAERRGWLALPRLTIATTYPLGLVRAWSYCAPDQRCLVYPAPAAEAPPLPRAADGRDGVARSGAGRDDFAGLRQHQLADSPRHVAWKAAARQGGPLLTKQFSGESARRVALDWDALPAAGVEPRLSILARWVCEAHAAGLAWSLRLPGAELGEGSGESHYHACLGALALHGQ